jgi:hypothetical protein
MASKMPKDAKPSFAYFLSTAKSEGESASKPRHDARGRWIKKVTEEIIKAPIKSTRNERMRLSINWLLPT